MSTSKDESGEDWISREMFKRYMNTPVRQPQRPEEWSARGEIINEIFGNPLQENGEDENTDVEGDV
jgi:hypothetical protein